MTESDRKKQKQLIKNGWYSRGLNVHQFKSDCRYTINLYEYIFYKLINMGKHINLLILYIMTHTYLQTT